MKGPCKHGLGYPGDHAELDAEGFAVWKSCGCRIVAPIDSTPALEDPTLGCGPPQFTTGPNDPFLNECVGHDKIDTMINLGDTVWTRKINDWFFKRNTARRVKVLRFLRGEDYSLRRKVYLKAVALYRWWKS